MTFHEELNNKAFREALDLLPSIRGDASLREILYKLCIVGFHDRTTELHSIIIGDLVLRRTRAMACSVEHIKLTANWEGPYKVTE